MTRRLNGWVSRARRLESAIGARVDRAAQALAGSAERAPLEVLHAIVDTVEDGLQPGSDGRRVLPSPHIRIMLAAITPDARVRLQTACAGPPSLQQRVVDRLTATGASTDGVVVKIVFVSSPRNGWSDSAFHVDYTRVATAPPAATPPAEVRRLDLTVTHGMASRAHHAAHGARVTLGRGVEVRDQRQRLLQTNAIAFNDDRSDVNGSVSRRHAHIDREATGGAYRLHDDTDGRTSVIRDGRGLSVPRGRGLRLRSGDVIVLGQARILVRMS